VSIYDHPVTALDGAPADLHDYAGKALLVVNVASKCGHTPQYGGLQELHETYRGRGFEVLGFPCNQFGGQEPGTAEEIAQFCSASYRVSFPMFAKIEVNGEGRDPLYAELAAHPDSTGEAGDVAWNFEKFLVSPAGAVVGRYRSRIQPSDPELVEAIEAQLPG
jgi:glutathione peroxidase